MRGQNSGLARVIGRTDAIIAMLRLTAVMPAILAILFGLLLLYGTGMAGADVLHNAAHDARHGLTFPCH